MLKSLMINKVLELIVLAFGFLGFGVVLGRQSMKKRVSDAEYEKRMSDLVSKEALLRADIKARLDAVDHDELLSRVLDTGRADAQPPTLPKGKPG